MRYMVLDDSSSAKRNDVVVAATYDNNTKALGAQFANVCKVVLARIEGEMSHSVDKAVRQRWFVARGVVSSN